MRDPVPIPVPVAASRRPPAPIASRPEAEQLIAHLFPVMHMMLELLKNETELVRAGRLGEVARLELRKAELARLYFADAALVKVSSAFLKRELPGMVAELRGWHDTFAARPAAKANEAVDD